jgi:hypothetical protein
MPSTFPVPLRGLSRGSARRRAAASRKGVVLAAIVGSVLTLGIASVAIVNTLRAPKATSQAPSQPPTALTTAPDASALGATGPGASAQGAEFFAQLFDRTDPTRIEADIRADRSRPLDARTQELTRPVAWIALRDGRLLYARAQRGQVRLSRESTAASLETGELEGDVLVLIFAPSNTTPDPQRTPALARLTTDALTIDWAQGEMRVPSTLRAQLDQIVFEGSDVTARFDPVDNRLLFAHVTSTKQLSIAPRSVQALREATPATASDGSANAAPSSLPGQHAAKGQTSAQAEPSLLRTEDLFRLVASGDVRVRQGDKSLATPLLSTWLRLLDGALPRPLATERQSEQRALQSEENLLSKNTAAESSDAESGLAGSTAQASGSSVASQSSEPIEASWTGPLEVRRLPAAPNELANDDLFLAASIDSGATPASDAPAFVTIADDAVGLVATGSAATIAGTRGDFVLSSTPTRAATLTLGTLGSMEASSLRINLPASLAQVTGAGTLTLQRDEQGKAPLDGLLTGGPQGSTQRPGSAGTISWSRGAEFSFVSDADQSSASPTTINKAQFVGDVRAENEQAIIEGDTLITQFEPASASPTRGKARPTLRTVWVQGQAALRAKQNANAPQAGASTPGDAQTPQPGWLRAQLVEASFGEDARTGSPVAQRLSASGQVRIEQQGQSLRCDDLEVRFVDAAVDASRRTLALRQGDEPDASAAPESSLALGSIERLEAQGNVDIQSPRDGLLAQGHHLVALPAERSYVLTSDAADQAYNPVLAVKDGASVRAPRIAIDVAQNVLRAEGLGTIGYGLDASPALPGASATNPDLPVAQGGFTQSLEVRGAEGIATLKGDARVRTSTAPGQVQTLEAPLLTLRFAASSDQQARSTPNAPAGVRTIEATLDDASASDGFGANDTTPAVRIALRTLAPGAAQPLQPKDLVALEESALAQLPASQVLTIATTRVLADLPAGTIDILAPGTLRVANLSATPKPPPGPQPEPSDTPASDSLTTNAGNLATFRWAGSLRLRKEASAGPSDESQRAKINGQMEGSVRMVRVDGSALSPAGELRTTELTCEQLVASFVQAQATGDSSDQLRSVQAQRSVWVRSQGRELTCSLLTFDPQQTLIDATGEPSIPVALSNPGGTPLLAQRVLWNTTTGRIDVLQPIVTAAP